MGGCPLRGMLGVRGGKEGGVRPVPTLRLLKLRAPALPLERPRSAPALQRWAAMGGCPLRGMLGVRGGKEGGVRPVPTLRLLKLRAPTLPLERPRSAPALERWAADGWVPVSWGSWDAWDAWGEGRRGPARSDAALAEASRSGFATGASALCSRTGAMGCRWVGARFILQTQPPKPISASALPAKPFRPGPWHNQFPFSRHSRMLPCDDNMDSHGFMKN
jgi:hypothetical protein